MAAAQPPAYAGFAYPGQPATISATNPVPAAQPVATDPNAYAQYYAQYAQYAQYAAQYQQYAAAQAAAHQVQQPQAAAQPAAITTPKTVTEVPTYQSNTQKQFQPHTVQISGLDKAKAPNIKDITDKFGTVGTIKKNQYGQASVRCRPDDGIVTVEYEAASSVESAIKWFNDSEIDGCTVKVEVAPASSPDVSTVRATTTEPSQDFAPQSAVPAPPAHYQPPGYPPGPHMPPHHPPPFPYGPPPPHFGPHGPPHMQGPPRPNVPPRPGDWDCVHCGNSNFQFRQECRRCKVPRTDAEKGKVSSDKPAAGMGPRPPFRPPFHPGFPPRGHPFMRPPHIHPGMRPPFMGGPPRPFFPYRHSRPPYQGAGAKRKQPYSATSSTAKEQKTEEKKE